jgi:hypothetical protein
MIRSLPPALLAALLATACQTTLPGSGGSDIAQSVAAAPPGAPPGTCWGKEVTPAIVETVTEQAVAEPATVAEDGTLTGPAVYETKTRQAIVQDRTVTWIEIPCPEARTPDFAASVQRALKVRGLYDGPVTGRMDAPTRAAVRRFQQPRGIDSGILSLASARELGLVAIERPAAE